MTTDQIKITFQCKKCGGAVLELSDNYTEDSIAVCKSCRTEFGRWGDIKAKAMFQAKDEVGQQVRKIFRDTFKGMKGWTIK